MPVFLKSILTRTIVLYLLCFVLIWRLLDWHELANNAVPQTLSRLTPPIDYFADFVDKKDHYNYFDLMDCINYHQAVAQFFPVQKAESLGMMGFCYERLGRPQDAIASYRQAISSNPDYFWPYYDLGVVYFNQSNYSLAADYFKQALGQDPVRTIVLLSRSKVYNDVRLSQGSGSYDLVQSLKEGRMQAYVLTMISLYKPGIKANFDLRVRFF